MGRAQGTQKFCLILTGLVVSPELMGPWAHEPALGTLLATELVDWPGSVLSCGFVCAWALSDWCGMKRLIVPDIRMHESPWSATIWSSIPQE